MSWDSIALVASVVALAPLAYFAMKLSGPVAWILWAIVIFFALNALIFLWLNVMWKLVLKIFGDVF